MQTETFGSLQKATNKLLKRTLNSWLASFLAILASYLAPLSKALGLMESLVNNLKRFSCSFMSNTKWRKLFSVVNETNTEFTNCQWKLVNDSEPVLGHLPDFDSLGDYYVGDCGALNGPFDFDLIEWLLVPTSLGYKPYESSPVVYKNQSVTHLVEQLNSIGEFQIETVDDGIKIFGYKP